MAVHNLRRSVSRISACARSVPSRNLCWTRLPLWLIFQPSWRAYCPCLSGFDSRVFLVATMLACPVLRWIPSPIRDDTRLIGLEKGSYRTNYRTSYRTIDQNGGRGTVKTGQPISVSPLKKATCDNCKWPFEMEAAGIEPASRDASTLASTCVVEPFWLLEETFSLATALLDRLRGSLTRIGF